MRKRCSVIADSRPPLKTLKSLVPRSNIKEVPRAAKIPRFHSFRAEAVESRSVPLDSNENVCSTEHDENGAEKECQNVETVRNEKEGSLVCVWTKSSLPFSIILTPLIWTQAGDVTPAAFKFSVSRLPPWAQAKIARDDAPASGGKEEGNSTGNTRKTFQSRWAEVRRDSLSFSSVGFMDWFV